MHALSGNFTGIKRRSSGYWHLNGNALYNVHDRTFRFILQRIAQMYSKPKPALNKVDSAHYDKLGRWGYDVQVTQAFRDFSNERSPSALHEWYVKQYANQEGTGGGGDAWNRESDTNHKMTHTIEEISCAAFPTPSKVFETYLAEVPFLRNFDPHVGATKEYFSALDNWRVGPHLAAGTYFIHGGHQMMDIYERHLRKSSASSQTNATHGKQSRCW